MSFQYPVTVVKGTRIVNKYLITFNRNTSGNFPGSILIFLMISQININKRVKETGRNIGFYSETSIVNWYQKDNKKSKKLVYENIGIYQFLTAL